MVSLRRFDAFAKTRPDLQEKSVVGGIITVIASSTAALLFLGQIYLYIRGNTRHSLALSKSISTPLVALQQQEYDKNFGLNRRGRTNLFVHVTFPHVDCSHLDVFHDGAALSSGELEKIHGSHSLNMRKPSASEIRKVLNGKKDKTINTVNGCTIVGQLHPYIVAGSFSICLNYRAWTEASAGLTLGVRMGGLGDSMSKYNVSHHIHSIRFGHAFPKETDKPLEDVSHIIENDFYGIAVSQTQVKLVPTVSRGQFFNDQMYQMSVVDILVQPSALIAAGGQQLPGLTVSYDFTPLTVHQLETREPFLVFLSSLISIVGGVFVTVALLTGCLVHSAQAVAKKID